MGPGRYSIKDFIETDDLRPRSNRGICDARDSRFPQEDKVHGNIPGPGSYGKGGIPSAAFEEKAKVSFSNVGMLESDGQGAFRATRSEGSGLTPGSYRYKNSIDELLKKSVSTRGPYDLLTGKRNKFPRHLVS